MFINCTAINEHVVNLNLSSEVICDYFLSIFSSYDNSFFNLDSLLDKIYWARIVIVYRYSIRVSHKILVTYI